MVRSGNTKGGGKLFSGMLKDNPNVPQVHLLLGEAHAELSEYPDALAEFSRALELDPKLAEAHRSEEHTSELQSPCNLVCRLLLEKKKNTVNRQQPTRHLGPSASNYPYSHR